MKIICRAGYRVNDNNECEKVQDKKPVAKRDDTKKPDRAERAKTEATPAKPQASGQMICGNGGCRPVKKGCRLEYGSFGGRYGSAATTTEVCN